MKDFVVIDGVLREWEIDMRLKGAKALRCCAAAAAKMECEKEKWTVWTVIGAYAIVKNCSPSAVHSAITYVLRKAGVKISAPDAIVYLANMVCCLQEVKQ